MRRAFVGWRRAAPRRGHSGCSLPHLPAFDDEAEHPVATATDYRLRLRLPTADCDCRLRLRPPTVTSTATATATATAIRLRAATCVSDGLCAVEHQGERARGDRIVRGASLLLPVRVATARAGHLRGGGPRRAAPSGFLTGRSADAGDGERDRATLRASHARGSVGVGPRRTRALVGGRGRRTTSAARPGAGGPEPEDQGAEACTLAFSEEHTRRRSLREADPGQPTSPSRAVSIRHGVSQAYESLPRMCRAARPNSPRREARGTARLITLSRIII